MAVATYSADEVAELAGVSTFVVYQSVKRQEPPIGTLALRIGKRVVWPRSAIDRLLGLDEAREP